MTLTMSQLKTQQRMIRLLGQHFQLLADSGTLPGGVPLRKALERKADEALNQVSVLQCDLLGNIPPDACIMGVREKCDPPHQLTVCALCYREKVGLP